MEKARSRGTSTGVKNPTIPRPNHLVKNSSMTLLRTIIEASSSELCCHCHLRVETRANNFFECNRPTRHDTWAVHPSAHSQTPLLLYSFISPPFSLFHPGAVTVRRAIKSAAMCGGKQRNPGPFAYDFMCWVGRSVVLAKEIISEPCSDTRPNAIFLVAQTITDAYTGQFS